MSKLKPIGSEKLQGMDKIQRIMEIARYNENIPNSINETSSVDYRVTLADGNTYEIVKERLGYMGVLSYYCVKTQNMKNIVFHKM